MSGVTDNYGLILPSAGEPYDVGITNANNIETDKQIKLNSNRAKKAPAVSGWAGNGSTWGVSADAVLNTADFKLLPGTYVGSTDASGYVGIDMPYTFPNGYYVVSMVNGDVIALNGVVFALSTGIFTNLANRFYIKLSNGSGVAFSNISFRMNYLVVGW